MRQHSLIDLLIFKLETGLQSFKGRRPSAQSSSRPSHPHPSKASDTLTDTLSGRLLRVNHSGEICAQALYEAQALCARDPKLKSHFKEAAMEEENHLRWCEDRLKELGTKPSVLNPLWALGSFAIGTAFGLAGDKISLGFLAETEHQVVAHLDKHLKLLPKDDFKSQAILQKMREEELQHADIAIQKGGVPLPKLIKKLMNVSSRIMTFTAKYI